MNVLVINSGSSSLKFQLMNVKDGNVIIKGHVDGIGLSSCIVKVGNTEIQKQIKDHESAIKIVFENLDTSLIDAIGHRVVHGGIYPSAKKVDANVIKELERLCQLAPLHNPAAIVGINACKHLLPKVKQVVVFDTAFHQTIEEDRFLYPIPYNFYTKNKIRKYGFHGTSHKFITYGMAKILKKKSVNLIICHLGNGASISAIKNNKVVDTSMGLTPLAGLMMGTRCGDIDAEVVNFISKEEKMSNDEIFKLLNKDSGLKGITGNSDMRDVRANALKGDKKSILAIKMYSNKITSYIAQYIPLVGKIDAIVFTAGLGQGAFYLRDQVISNLSCFGFKLDKKKNSVPWIDKNTLISNKDSKAKIFVIPTNEELMIAKETAEVLMQK